LKLGLKLRRDFKYFVKSLDKNSFAKLLGKYEMEDKPTFIFDNKGHTHSLREQEPEIDVSCGEESGLDYRLEIESDVAFWEALKSR
jgi:hypothetical protein